MGDVAGYILAGLSIVTTITITAVKGAVEASKEKKRLIAEVATEKASLRFECKEMKETAEEIKVLVKENYAVLANNLEALKMTMLQSDENLGSRIGKVESDVTDLKIKVGRHDEAIKNLKPAG